MPNITKLLRKYQGLIISLIMIGITLVGVLVGIIPGVQKIIDIQNQSMQLSKTIQVLRNKITILESQDESVYRDEFAQLLAAVPGDKSLPTLFTTLDGLGQQSGVTLSDFSLVRLGSIATGSAEKRSAEEEKLGSNLLPFTITVNGNYDQVYTFLSQVNNVRRFFRVRNFEISFSDMSSISVHMGMDAFYAPITTSIGSIESPLQPLSSKDVDLIKQISEMPYLGQVTEAAPAATSNSESRGNLFAP